MDLPFKHTTRFYQDISLANLEEEQFISSASLESLKSMAPEGIDFEKNIDLVGVAFNAAVANKFNKNGDGIDTATAVAIKDYFIHKPTNIEHQKQKVVGHIVGASLSSYGDNQMITPEEAMQKDEPFNIALSAVIYKTVNKDFAELVEKSVDESSEFYHKVSASWEIGFNDYAIALGSENLHESEIIEGEQKEDYKQYLRAYGGNGRTDKGVKVYRLIMGDIYPLGIGFTANPAADVKGLTTFDEQQKQLQVKTKKVVSFHRLKIKNNIFEEKSSQTQKGDVIFNKNHKPVKTMEKEILEQVKETLEAQASSKKLSEEAIANITKVFHDAIIQKNDQWQQDKESLVKEKEELVKASEESAKELQSLKEELAGVNQQVSELKTEICAREEAEKFTDRMSELDDVFELEDEDRMILASELKSLSSEESYAEYKEKLAVVWKHKTKAFKEEQEKVIAEKIEAEVQKRLSTLSEKESTSEASEEEVEEVIESVEAEEADIANNDAAAAEEELSLRDKFKQAFNKESVNIKY
jgi:hypothetical protein